MLVRPGFQELGDGPETDQINTWVAGFNDKQGRSARAYPSPVLIGRIMDGVTEEQLEGFAASVHAAMKTLVAPGEYLLHADYQHWYGRFYPHAAPILEDLIIDGETAGFVAPDQSTGVLCIGWDGRTLACFFGAGLVSAIVRQGGRVENGRLWPFLEPP